MKERLIYALENMKKYNEGIMYQECFGFEPDVEYDALVVAPGWKPTKIIKDPAYTVTELAQKYVHTRSVVIPDMIFKIAGRKKSA